MIIELRKYNKIGELLIGIEATGSQGHIVKNGFSNLTKEQEGRDWQGKDITNDCQGKALREGCRERKKARTSVSSREKKDTNRNLVRATTKSKSRMQQSLMDVSVKERGIKVFEECPNVRDLIK